MKKNTSLDSKEEFSDNNKKSSSSKKKKETIKKNIKTSKNTSIKRKKSSNKQSKKKPSKVIEGINNTQDDSESLIQEIENAFEEELSEVYEIIHNEMHLAYGDFSEEEHNWLYESFNNCLYLCNLLADPKQKKQELLQSYNDFKKTQIQLHTALLFASMLWIPSIKEFFEQEKETYIPD